MTADGIGRIGPLPSPPTASEKLRKAAHDFEGVFMAQLFREMRASVQVTEENPGAEMFTSLLDEAMANEAAARSTRGIGEALYRQLAQRLHVGDSDMNGAGHGDGTS